MYLLLTTINENSPPFNTINHYWSLWIPLINYSPSFYSLLGDRHSSVKSTISSCPGWRIEITVDRALSWSWPARFWRLIICFWVELVHRGDLWRDWKTSDGPYMAATGSRSHSNVPWWSQKNCHGAGCSCQQDSWSCWKVLTHVWKNRGNTVKFPIKVQVDGYPILEHIHLDANANVPKNNLVLYDWTGGF